jgi:hypothetical protein
MSNPRNRVGTDCRKGGKTCAVTCASRGWHRTGRSALSRGVQIRREDAKQPATAPGTAGDSPGRRLAKPRCSCTPRIFPIVNSSPEHMPHLLEGTSSTLGFTIKEVAFGPGDRYWDGDCSGSQYPGRERTREDGACAEANSTLVNPRYYTHAVLYSYRNMPIR